MPSRVGQKVGFFIKKKTQPGGFFWVLLGFIGFFWVFLGFFNLRSFLVHFFNENWIFSTNLTFISNKMNKFGQKALLQISLMFAFTLLPQPNSSEFGTTVGYIQ